MSLKAKVALCAAIVGAILAINFISQCQARQASERMDEVAERMGTFGDMVRQYE